MTTEEDREFQLEKLKVQLKHQALWSSLTLLIAVEFAAFISIAATFLSYGLTSENMYYIFVGLSSLVCLYIVVIGTVRYLESKKIERVLDKNLEREIQSIRDRFITKEREQEGIEEERSEMSSEDEEKRDKLIYEIIVDRYNLEWKRTNDLDSKASSVTGFAGLLATLTAGIAKLFPESPYSFLLFVPLTVFILSAVSGLWAYWITDFIAINPDTLIQEYAEKTKTEVLRTFVATTSEITMLNYSFNQRKVRRIYGAFILLVVAIGLFFAISIISLML